MSTESLYCLNHIVCGHFLSDMLCHCVRSRQGFTTKMRPELRSTVMGGAEPEFSKMETLLWFYAGIINVKSTGTSGRPLAKTMPASLPPTGTRLAKDPYYYPLLRPPTAMTALNLHDKMTLSDLRGGDRQDKAADSCAYVHMLRVSAEKCG